MSRENIYFAFIFSQQIKKLPKTGAFNSYILEHACAEHLTENPENRARLIALTRD